LLGLVLVALDLTGTVSRLARVLPKTVLTGIQLGGGLYLAWDGVRLGMQETVLGRLPLAALFVLQPSPLKPSSALIVLAGASIWGA
jgi:hypothetical protein